MVQLPTDPRGPEVRTGVLSTIAWNTTVTPTGGDWDTANNWVGGQVPGPADTASITKLTSPGNVSLTSSAADSISALTTDSTATLEVVNGSLTLGAASNSTIGGRSPSSRGDLNVGSARSSPSRPGSRSRSTARPTSRPGHRGDQRRHRRLLQPGAGRHRRGRPAAPAP